MARGEPTLRTALVSALLVASTLGACAPLVRQTGAPLRLPSSLPDTPCERADWIYLVPAEAVQDPAAALRSPGVYRYGGGLAAFRTLTFGATLVPPLALTSVLPEGSEPFLERHLEPLRPHRPRMRTGVALMVSGGAIALGGVIAGATVDALTTDPVRDGREASNDIATGLILGGVVGGFALAMIGYSIVPEQRWMESIYRDHFVGPNEDDVTLVSRGVSERNASTRARCAREPP
jgi:hypothetical protein